MSVDTPQGPDDCAFPLVAACVEIHMQACGSSDCVSLERLKMLVGWVEGRVGEHWYEPTRNFDSTVRAMGIAAVEEGRAFIERMRLAGWEG